MWFFGCFDDFLAVFDYHLLGVVVVEITLEDLDFAHPRPTKIRLFGAAPDDFGVSEADVPEKWGKNVIKNQNFLAEFLKKFCNLKNNFFGC